MVGPVLQPRERSTSELPLAQWLEFDQIGRYSVSVVFNGAIRILQLSLITVILLALGSLAWRMWYLPADLPQE
jgi:hypothetical protein